MIVQSNCNDIHGGKPKIYKAEYLIRGVDKSLARPGRKQATAKENFDVHKSNL